MPTTAGAPPGSGANFAALKSKLAARGAKDPGALAAYIGRRKYGKKRFGAMSHHHSNDMKGTIDMGIIDMAVTTCPRCGYSADNAEFKTENNVANGTSTDSSPGLLRTPAPGTGFVRNGAPLTVRTGAGGAGLANGRQRRIDLARRVPVSDRSDLMVGRSPSGSAVIRHRRGGELITELKQNADGTWTATVDGSPLHPHTRQAGALAEAIGVYNHAGQMPLSQPPVQSPLLAQMGVQNVRAFASDGDGDEDEDDDSGSGGGSNGLTPKGQAIYKKLTAKGVSPKVAMAMAKRSQNAKPGAFSKAG